MSIKRTILAVMAGALTWAALWLGGTNAAMAAFPEPLASGQRLEHVGFLTAYIGYSVALSLLAGFVAAVVSGRPGASRAVWVLAGLQLLLGVVAEVSYWSLTPVWYHVVFLALIVPATVQGGRLRSAEAAPAA